MLLLVYDMQIRPVVASVVGETSPTHWGQVLQLPNAYGVVEVAADDAIARQRGVTILSKLTHELEGGPVSLESVVAIADSVVAPDVTTVALLVPVGKIVYLVLRGEGAIYMRRGEKFATLLGESGEVSGEVQEGDCIVASSRGFTTSLTSEEIGGVFDHLTPSEVAEKLTLLLHEKQNGNGGAAFIFEVSRLVSPEETPPAPSQEGEAQATPPRMRVLMGQVRRAGGAFFRRTMREKRLAITVLLVGLFLFSIFLGIRKQTSNTQARQATAVISEAQHAFDEGMALLDLNPQKGRERLGQAKEMLAPLVSSLSARSPDGKKAHDLYEQIQQSVTRAQHVVNVSPTVFYDVSLVKKDAKATAVGLTGDRMGLLDGLGRTVYDLTLAGKNGQIAAGGDQYTNAMGVAVYGDRLYVLVPEGVNMIRLTDRKTVPLVVKKDDGWGTVMSIAAYGGNLYLLDSAKSRIWKYVATETGFTERREYLNPDTFPDLSHATGMAIDGSVFVGTTEGKVLHFAQGKEQTYILQGLDMALGKNIQVYTNDVQKYVYILDGTNKRVVVFDKDGFYMAQYVWVGEFAPTAVVVSEGLKQIYLLSGGKIYSVAME